MRDKSYDWAEAAENWANEVLGADETHQIDLPDAQIKPRIETFEPQDAPEIPEGFTCEDKPSVSATPFGEETEEPEDALDPRQPEKPKDQDQQSKMFRTRRTVVKITEKHIDSDTFVFSPNQPD